MKKCIEFKNSAGNQELYFYGDIVSDEWSKWTDSDTCPQDIQEVLSQIDEKKPLNIYVNSGGGSVFAGLAIYNMLKRSQCEKTVYIDGLAASIASVIAMAGDKIVIPSNAFLMIHKPWNIIGGNANEMRKMADDLDRIEEGILNVYAEKLAENCTIETIKQMVNDETWIVGSEASKYFNIEVVQSNKAVASISNLSNYSKVPKELTKEEQNNSDGDCICSNCNHSDNCQSSNSKCCICGNCNMVSQCSKPGTNGCKCSVCTMAQSNCCQPGSDSCLCSDCSNQDCAKGNVIDDSTTDNMNKANLMEVENLKARLQLELIL